MTPEKPLSARMALRAIPREVRPLVVAWLHASAVEADHTATNLFAANREIRDPATAGTANHWRAVASAARLLASRLATASPRKRAQDQGAQDEPTEC